MSGSLIEKLYTQKCKSPSDIFEHLPTLRRYTMNCSSVVECGVRDVVSSYAFADGLRHKKNNKYFLVDPYKSSEIDKFLSLCKSEGVNAEFINQSDIECPLVDTDLLFIDTWHVYGHLKRELDYWKLNVKKYIIMHDTTVDEWLGETIRNRWNAEQQSKDTGIPVEEINKGLWPAVEEFIYNNKQWHIKERHINNNGLTVLERKE
jgi:hypothetical protein